MNLDKKYWSDRYKEESTKWDLGTVSPPIKEYIDQIEDRSLNVLIPGSGNAHEAEYMHLKGFKNVYVADIAIEPLKNLINRVPSFPETHLLQQDFFDLEMKFDLIIEQTFFCALNPKLREHYASKMHSSIKMGGKLVGLFFDFPLTNAGPPFGGNKLEYENLFMPYFEITKLEKCYNSIPPRSGNELFFIFKKIK